MAASTKQASGFAGVNWANLGINLGIGELLGYYQVRQLEKDAQRIVPKTIKDASFTTPVDGEAIPVVLGYKYLSSELKTIYAGGFSSSKVIKTKEIQVSLLQKAKIANEVAAIYSYNSLVATVCHKGGTILSYTVTPDADPLTIPAAHGFANSTSSMHINQSGFIGGIYQTSNKNWPINAVFRHYNELPLADNMFGIYSNNDTDSATLYRRGVPTSTRVSKTEDTSNSYSSSGYKGYFINGSPMYTIGSIDDSDPYLVRYKTLKCSSLLSNGAAPYTPNASWISFSGSVGTDVSPVGFGAYVKDMCIETMSALYKICKVHIASGNYTTNMTNFVSLVESTAANAPKSYAATSGTNAVSLFDNTTWIQVSGSYSFGDATTALPYALMACAEVDDGSGLTATSIAGIGLNPAIAVLDLMTHERGYNLRFEAIDIDSFLQCFFYYRSNGAHVNLVSSKTSDVKSVIESILMDTYSMIVADKNQSTYGLKCLLQDSTVKHAFTDAEIISVSSLKKYDIDNFYTKVILSYQDVLTNSTATIVETSPQHDAANGRTLEYSCDTASSAFQARRIASTILSRFSKPYAVISIKVQDNSGDYRLGDLCSIQASSVGFISTGMRIVSISNEFNNISGELELTLQEDLSANSFYFEVDVPAGVSGSANGVSGSAKFPKEVFMLQASQAHLSADPVSLQDFSDASFLVMTPPEAPLATNSSIVIEKDGEVATREYSLFVKLVSEVVDCPVSDYPSNDEAYQSFIANSAKWTGAYEYNSLTNKGGSPFGPVVTDSNTANGIIDYKPVYRHKLKISHAGTIAGGRSAGEVANLLSILKTNFRIGTWNMLYFPMPSNYSSSIGAERESALIKVMGYGSDCVYVKMIRGVFNEVPYNYSKLTDLLAVPLGTLFYARTGMYISCRTGVQSTFNTSTTFDGFASTSSGTLTSSVESSGRFGSAEKLKLDYILSPFGTSSEGAPYHSSVQHKSGFYLGTGYGLASFTTYKRFDIRGLYCSCTGHNGGLISWTASLTSASLTTGGTYFKEAIDFQNGSSVSSGSVMNTANVCWKVGNTSATDTAISSLNGSFKLNSTPYDVDSIATKTRTLSLSYSGTAGSGIISREMTADSGVEIFSFQTPITSANADYIRYNLAPSAIDVEPLIFGFDSEFQAESSLACENVHAKRTDPNFRVCAISITSVSGSALVNLTQPEYDGNNALLGYKQAEVTYTTLSSGSKLELLYPDLGYEFKFEAKQGTVAADLMLEPLSGELNSSAPVNSGNSRYCISDYSEITDGASPAIFENYSKVISELIGKPKLMAPRFKPNTSVDASTAMTQLLGKLDLFYGATYSGSIRTYPMISVPNNSSTNQITLRNWVPEEPDYRENKPFTFDSRPYINSIRNTIASDRRPDDLYVAYDFFAASGLCVVEDFVNPWDGLTYKAFKENGAENFYNVINFGTFCISTHPLPVYRIFACSFKQ